MSLFGSIMNKIFGHASAAPAADDAAPSPTSGPSGASVGGVGIRCGRR